jgi:hypothetical protein
MGSKLILESTIPILDRKVGRGCSTLIPVSKACMASKCCYQCFCQFCRITTHPCITLIRFEVSLETSANQDWEILITFLRQQGSITLQKMQAYAISSQAVAMELATSQPWVLANSSPLVSSQILYVIGSLRMTSRFSSRLLRFLYLIIKSTPCPCPPHFQFQDMKANIGWALGILWFFNNCQFWFKMFQHQTIPHFSFFSLGLWRGDHNQRTWKPSKN